MAKKSLQDISNDTVLRAKKRRIFMDNLTFFSMALPGILCVIVFKYFPMPYLALAFKKYVPRLGLFRSKWVGFENFKFLFATNDIQRLIRNTVLYGVFFLVIDIVVGMVIALMLYYVTNKTASNTYKMLFQFPRFLSVVVVSYLVYAFLSPSYGIANQVVSLFGGESIKWYQESQYWPIILTVVHIWMTLGSGCLLYYATLMGIDSSLFEAASLDGANTWQKCRYISIPALRPVTCMNLTFGVGGIIGGDLGVFYNIPLAHGELLPTTDIINTYVYRSLVSGDISRPIAVGLFQSVIALVMVLLTNALMRKISPENAMF